MMFITYVQVAATHFHHHTRSHQYVPHAASSAHLTAPLAAAVAYHHEIDGLAAAGPPPRQIMSGPAGDVTTKSSVPIITGN